MCSPHLQNDVDAALLIDRQNNPGLDKRLEALECGLHLVSSRRERQQPVLAGGVSGGLRDQVRIDVRRGNVNTLHDCRRLVGHDPEDRPRDIREQRGD